MGGVARTLHSACRGVERTGATAMNCAHLPRYSSAACDVVVRETFGPVPSHPGPAPSHPRAVRTRYSHVNGEPGFTKRARDAISTQVRVDTAIGRHTVCSLMLDEMAIRRHVELVNGKHHGFVVIGNSQVDDSTSATKDGMSGAERANIVNEESHRLYH